MELAMVCRRRALAHGICVLAVLLCAGSTAVQAEDSNPRPRSVRPFFDSGAFVGSETSLKYYEESTFRLHGELGVDVARETSTGATGPAVGFGLTAIVGKEESRLGLGPRVTWPVHPRWALQATAGPAWSSEEESKGATDLGWQARTGLLYRRTVSLSVLAQTFPYEEPFSGDAPKRLSSIYGGIMLHGRVGATSSVVVWGSLAILVFAYIASGSAY